MVTIQKWGRAFPVLLAGALVLLTACGPPGPKALLEGERLIREGKPAAAIEPLKDATRLLPRNPQAWNHLGLAYHGAGFPQEAVGSYRRALTLDQNLSSARYNLGCVLLEGGQPAAAQTELMGYVNLVPRDPNGWLKLGTAQVRLQQSEAGERSIRQSLSLNPRQPEALNALGMIMLRRQQLKESLAFFQNALQVQPDYGPALLNLALLYHHHVPGRNVETRRYALQKYREYLALKPRPANHAAVQELAAGLEREFAPASRPAATAHVAVPTNLVAKASNAVAAAVGRASAPKPAPPVAVAKVDPPPVPVIKAEPPRVTNVVTISPKPAPPAPAPPAPPKPPVIPEVASVPTPRPTPPPAPAPAVTVAVPMPRKSAPGIDLEPSADSRPAFPPPPATATVKPAPVFPPPPAFPAVPAVSVAPPSAPVTAANPTAPAPLITRTTTITPIPNLTPQPRTTPAPPADTTQYIVQNEPVKITAAEKEKPGFWSRNNPVNLFRSKPKSPPAVTPLGPPSARSTASSPAPRPATPASRPSPVIAMVPPASPFAAPATPPSAPVVTLRYSYRNPPRPPAGNRPEAETHFIRAAAAQKQGDSNQALQSLRNAVALDPGFFEAQHNLGTVALESGNLPEALTAFESALALRPGAANTRYNFALGLRKGAYHQDAATELLRALADDPGDVQGHFVLANLYAQQLRQPLAAREHYERVLALRPSHPQAANIRKWLRDN